MPSNLLNPLISGAFAGLMVDTVLYPIDTIKTRLQAAEGFKKSGGFRGLYKGLSSAVIGAAPGAGLFFLGYESFRNYYLSNLNSANQTKTIDLSGEIMASCLAEVCACLARCPTENVKQNAQVNLNLTTGQVFRQLYKNRGLLGFYRGYFTLVAREIPFAAIQMPLWQNLKFYFDVANSQHQAFYSACLGAVAGSIAAATTTPLDVAKTRQMLDKSKEQKSTNIVQTLKNIYKQNGVKGLFSGVTPRVIWITFGGFIFLGSYEYAQLNLPF